jgi:hypothetical protein
MGCLELALTSVPAGIWLCPHCEEAERARQELWPASGREVNGPTHASSTSPFILMASRQIACSVHVSGHGSGGLNFGLLRP